MKIYCPNCKEAIHDPNRKICGICGALLPRALASTPPTEPSSKDAAKAAQIQKRSDAEGLLS
jgi:rRNA maturation endonuclease Nob1